MIVTVYTVSTGHRVRLSTLSREEAVRHAQKVYREEGTIADILEHERKTNR
jgi:hypothetical protein